MEFAGLDFTPLERAIPDAICEMNLPDRALLQKQLAAAKVLSRKNTGAGFYADFSVDRTLCAAIGGDGLRNGPADVRIEGLRNGMGFILWLKEGFAECLEGYSYDEDTTDIRFDSEDSRL